MKRTRRTALSLALVLAAVVALPSGVSSTVAAWNDEEWATGTVGTSSFDCGTDTGYSEAARSTFLRGALLGQDLGAIAGLAPLVLQRSGDAPATVSPATAVNVGANDGDPGRDTFARPLVVSALNIVGLDLTGLQVGLPGASVSAVDQFARVSTTGTSIAASGFVDDTGAVLVDEDTPADELPEPARLSLGGILPGISGVADAGLRVGAVGSTASLDACAVELSDTWGDGSDTGLDRDYGIAGLDLAFRSSTVSALSTQVTSTVSSLNATVTGLVGTNGTLSTVIRNQLLGNLLAVLDLGSFTGTVAINDLDLAGAVQPFLSTPISDGVVTLDPSSGAVDIDLAYLLGDDANGVNDLAPNTELVVNATVINDLTARIGVLVDGWRAQVVNALRSEIASAQIVIDLNTTVRLGVAALATVDVDLTTTVGQLAGTGTVPLTVTAVAAPGSSVLNNTLALLGVNATVSSIVAGLNGLTSTVLTALRTQITTSLVTPVDTAATTLATLTAPIVTALSAAVSALPSVLSLRVNVQPDQAGAPGGPALPGPTATSTGAFSVSALRIGLLGQVAPGGGVAYVEFATSTVGPNGFPTGP